MENHHFFQSILFYLHHHPTAGEWFAFLVSFAESLPIVGTIVPGSLTMTLVGILMGGGILPFTKTLFIVSLAAFMGDCIGYIVGFYYNERLRTVWPFKKYPQWLTMGEDFFKKHGGKSIIIGRFFGPARSTVPLIAGLLKLTWPRFMIAAIPSAVLWAMLYITPGLLLGALSREIPKADTTRFLIYGIGALAIIFTLSWLLQHFFKQLIRLINHATNTLWRIISQKKIGKFFIHTIADQQNPHEHHALTMLIFSIISGILFLILFFNVQHHGVLTNINYPVFHLLQSLRIAPLDHLFVCFTIIGTPKALLVMSLLFSLNLYLQKEKRAAFHLGAITLITAFAIFIFKKLSHYARPQGFVWVAKSFSFPSGHAAMSFAVFFFIAFLLSQKMKKKMRAIPYAIASILVFAISFSRIYLGAHWFDDVIGSLLLANTLLLATIICYQRMPKANEKFHLATKKSLILLALCFVLPFSIFIPACYTKIFLNSMPYWPEKNILMNDWWKNPFQVVPAYRNSRLGKPIQPINVQWAGSLSTIKNTLQDAGWKTLEKGSQLKTTLSRFASYDAQYHMPILPWLYHGKKSILFMFKPISSHKRIIELHLWQSDLYFSPNNKPLWIGVVDMRIPPKILISLKEHTIISMANDTGLTQLFLDTTHYDRKYLTLTQGKITDEAKKLKWDGRVLLIRER